MGGESPYFRKILLMFEAKTRLKLPLPEALLPSVDLSNGDVAVKKFLSLTCTHGNISIWHQEEIFDLTTDPSETINLVNLPEYDEVGAFLNETLASWVELSYPLRTYPTLVERAGELLKVSKVNTIHKIFSHLQVE